MAGISDPTEAIGIVELHDAFVHQLEISMAEFGLVPLGRADSLIEDGLMLDGGKYLVNRCGGLIYCGHAVGASNIMSAWSARKELLKRDAAPPWCMEQAALWRSSLLHDSGT